MEPPRNVMTERAVTKAIKEHQNRNRALRVHFEERKVSQNRPQPIDFHFWAWTQRDAAVLGKSLYQMGFLIRLLAPAPAATDPDRWSIEAGARIPLKEALSEQLTERLVRLAAQVDSIFDGWGTSV